MKAGKTYVEVGTRIKTTKRWDSEHTVTGEITHPFGKFGMYDFGAVAGIRIDEDYHYLFGDIGNLGPFDFEVVE